MRTTIRWLTGKKTKISLALFYSVFAVCKIFMNIVFTRLIIMIINLVKTKEIVDFLFLTQIILTELNAMVGA